MVLAVAITAVALVLIWLSAIAPALAWYADRADYLAQQQVLAARMQSVAWSAPALQQRLATADADTLPARAMFDGATDAVAGAALQQAVQDIATHAGATLLSAEMLPATSVGVYRRLSIHVTVSGSWSALTNLLGATLQATPRMLVDDLQFRQTQAIGARDTHPMEAGLTILAYNSAPQATR